MGLDLRRWSPESGFEARRSGLIKGFSRDRLSETDLADSSAAFLKIDTQGFEAEVLKGSTDAESHRSR